MTMNEMINTIMRTPFEREDMLAYIANVRNDLRLLSDFLVTSYGPSGPNDRVEDVRCSTMTGTQLRRASTNSAQGIWLSKLARLVATQTREPVNILELGTAAGISGMYLLAGLAQGAGGHLFTFEGAPELAEIASEHLQRFVMKFELSHVDFDIVVGNFNETIEPYIHELKGSLHLSFIDGNHREQATLRYHNLIRQAMDERGIIVYDDIGWSSGMLLAWRKIQEIEGQGRTLELYLGNYPSRGIVFLASESIGPAQIVHLDSIAERLGRQFKRFLRKR